VDGGGSGRRGHPYGAAPGGQARVQRTPGGFVVEGGQGGAPFALACADDADISAQELARYEEARYEEALRAAGYRVGLDPDDDEALRVWPMA
jgi:hypothetical protein